MWIAQLLSVMGFSFVLPFMSLYVQELGDYSSAEAAGHAGVLWAAMGISMAVFAPIWGVLADRHGRKIMVLRAMFGGTVVMVLMGFARNVGDLFVLQLLLGALTGTMTASVALVSSVVPREKSGYALGMMQAAVLGGGSVGPLLGGAITHYTSYRTAFIVAGLATLCGGLLVHVLAKENFTPVPAVQRQNVLTSFRELLRIGPYLLALLAIFQIQFAFTAPAPIFPLFVKELMGDPGRANMVTGAIFSASGLASALTVWKLGSLSDAWGHRKMLIACTLLAGLFALPQAFARSVTQLFLLRICLGVAAAGIAPSANAIIRNVVPTASLGRAFGVSASVAAIGFGMGPLVGGHIAERWLLQAPFLVSGVMLTAVAALVFLFGKGMSAPHVAAGARDARPEPRDSSVAIEAASPDSLRR